MGFITLILLLVIMSWCILVTYTLCGHPDVLLEYILNKHETMISIPEITPFSTI